MYKAIARNKRNTVIAIFVFVVLFVLIATPFAYFGYYNDDYTWYFISGAIIVFAVGYAFFQYYNASKLAIMASGGKPADETQYRELYHVIDELAIGYGLQRPPVYIIDDPSPNAFATGRDPEHAAVAVTTGLLERMNRDELEGVLAHEFAHIKNYDIRTSMIVFGLVAAIALLCDVLRQVGFSMMRGSNRRDSKDNGPAILIFAVIIMVSAIVLPFISLLVQLFVSRQREYAADATGAATLHNPIPLALALEKLEDPSIPSMKRQSTATAHLFFAQPLKKKGYINRLFDTHPPLEKRIARLLDMKDKAYSLPSAKLKAPKGATHGHIDAASGEMVWDEPAAPAPVAKGGVTTN
jgi:heat shock protein HtpX